MGNTDSKHISEQQQFINKLQTQIQQNQSQIENLKLQQINQMNTNYQQNYTNQTQNNIASNNIHSYQSQNNNPLMPNHPISNFYQNQEKQKIIESITSNPRQTIQENNTKLDKLHKILAEYRHLMTGQQLNKVKTLINSLESSNEVLANSTNNKLFLHNYGTRNQDPDSRQIELKISNK